MNLNSNIDPYKSLLLKANSNGKPLADLFIIYGIPNSSIKSMLLKFIVDPNSKLTPQILDTYPHTINQEELLSINLVYQSDIVAVFVLS